MSPFKYEFNISARTRKEALKLSRKFARGIGMVFSDLSLKKHPTKRVKGKPVFEAKGTLRGRKKKKRRR